MFSGSFCLLATVPRLEYPARKSNICLTPECVHAASEFLYNLSPDYKNIDPCTDFEEMVCGGWRDRHDLREDQGDAFTGTIMSDNSQLLLKHILEAPYPKDSSHSFYSPQQLTVMRRSVDEENFDLMKSAYDACLDEETINEKGIAPLMAVLHQIQQTFPVGAETSATTERSNRGVSAHAVDLRDTILLLSKYGISALVATGTGADDKDPDTVVAEVAPPWRIGLPSKERYEDEKLVKRYEMVLEQVCSALGRGRDCEITSDVVDFEKKLAAASPSTQEREDVTVRPLWFLWKYQ